MEESEAEKVEIETEDEVEIAGQFWSGGDDAVLLLHMMDATKENWLLLGMRLMGMDVSSLAIDLRGHGESDGGPQDYLEYDNSQHQAAIKDVEAAVEWIKNEGYNLKGIIGASIGANLALWYASDHSEVEKIGLLSPGRNYRGIEAPSLMKELESDQEVFLVSSTDDVQVAGNDQMTYEIYESNPDVAVDKPKIVMSSKHGTDIFEDDLDLVDDLAEWVAS